MVKSIIMREKEAVPLVELQNPHLELAQIAASGQVFTWERLGGNRWAIPCGRHFTQAVQEGHRVYFSCPEAEFASFWRGYFDLDTDYAAIHAAVDPADVYLCAAVSFGRGIRVLRQDLWEVLVSFLISQNNNIGRITGSVRTLRERWGSLLPDGNGGFFHAFPRPHELSGVSEADFRCAGLGYRARYLVRLAGELDGGGLEALERELDGLDDAGAETRLCALYGIGKKVADCVCLFGLHRRDFFPVDTHVKRLFAAHYPGGFPYDRYRGFLGILQQYLFYYDLRGGVPGGEGAMAP